MLFPYMSFKNVQTQRIKYATAYQVRYSVSSTLQRIKYAHSCYTLVKILKIMHKDVVSDPDLKLLMLITQLALVNDEMFLEIQHFLQHVKLSASSGIFIIVIQQVSRNRFCFLFIIFCQVYLETPSLLYT